MKSSNHVVSVIIAIATFFVVGFFILGNLPKVVITEKSVESSQSTESSPSQYLGPFYKVVKVIDGDTFDVLIDNKIQRVRLIGINAPETVDPIKPVECYGNESSAKLKQYLNNSEVALKLDPTQASIDVYSRLLRYAYLPDGTFINEQMVRLGFAYEYTYKTPYLYQKQFLADQKIAQNMKLGLWGISDCSK